MTTIIEPTIHEHSRIARLTRALQERSQADEARRRPLREREGAINVRLEAVKAEIAAARWPDVSGADFAALLGERDLLTIELERVRASYPPADPTIAGMASQLSEWKARFNRAADEIDFLSDTTNPAVRVLSLDEIETRLAAAKQTAEWLTGDDVSAAPYGVSTPGAPDVVI